MATMAVSRTLRVVLKVARTLVSNSIRGKVFHPVVRPSVPERGNHRIFPSEIPPGALTSRAGFTSIRFMAKKITPIKDRLSKTQIVDQIATDTELSRKQVAAVIDSLGDVIEAHIKKNAVGEFVLPGLLKISTVRKPAVKARKGINPFTKEEVMFKAKPATTAVKIRPLKKLKDMAL
jgi:nucleoid DNA-binding protein